MESVDDRRRLMRRLRRIEGQVQGVQRMVADGRDCREVVQQLAAVRAAVHHAGLEVVRVYAGQCLAERGDAAVDDDLLDYVIGTLGRWA